MDDATAKERFRKARALFAEQDYDGASKLLDELIDAFPGNSDLIRSRTRVRDAMQHAGRPTGVPHNGEALSSGGRSGTRRQPDPLAAAQQASPSYRWGLLAVCATLCAVSLAAAAVWGLWISRGRADISTAAPQTGEMTTQSNSVASPGQRVSVSPSTNETPADTAAAEGLDGPEQFAFFEVRVQILGDQGDPIQGAFLKAYCQDWPLLYPAQEQFLRTDSSGTGTFRVPRGEWIFMAAGGDPYLNGRTGRGLFMLDDVSVEADRTVQLRPTRSFAATFMDLRSLPCESDYLRAGVTSMAPICALMDIGQTRDGKCRIETNTDLPLTLFIGRKPTLNQEGYFVFWQRLEGRGEVSLQPERSELTTIQFECYDPQNRPGRVTWVFDFPYQDIEKRYAFVEFDLSGGGLAMFSPGFANYRPVVRLRDPAYQCDVSYELYLQGLKLRSGSQITLSAGGPLTRGLRFLPAPTGEDTRCMIMLGPTVDAHGNELQHYHRGIAGPDKDYKLPIRIRDEPSGNLLHEGTLDIRSDHMAFQLQKHFPESAVLELDSDLGPYGGHERFQTRLYAPEIRYELAVFPTEHFTVHVPAAHQIKGPMIARRLEDAYAAMARVLGVTLGKVDSDNFYVHPEGLWASARGQELFYHGFRWWHPNDPASKGWEGAALHEVGHRMVADAFACEPNPYPLQGHVNEAFASLLAQDAIAAIHGEAFAFAHREGEARRFFERLASPDNPPHTPKDNLFFIIQTYMPKHFGNDIHTRFCQSWKDACLVLSPQKYQHNEIVATLFSALGGKNLAWLFNYAEWNLDEARIAEGVRKLRDTTGRRANLSE